MGFSAIREDQKRVLARPSLPTYMDNLEAGSRCFVRSGGGCSQNWAGETESIDAHHDRQLALRIGRAIEQGKRDQPLTDAERAVMPS